MTIPNGVVLFFFFTIRHFCLPFAQRLTKRFFHVNGKQHVTCNLICEKIAGDLWQ